MLTKRRKINKMKNLKCQKNTIQTTIVNPYPQEQILINFAPKIRTGKILCTSPGRAQLAYAIAQQCPDAYIYCHYLDIYRAQLAREYIGNLPTNLLIKCAVDFPEQEFDTVILPISYVGEAELTRERMQAGYILLRLSGQMIVATDNKRDNWLYNEMKKLFDKVSRVSKKQGILYWATKTKPLKKIKNFSCEFAFRDKDQLIHAYSRPGVFSHRRVDIGARRLMEATKVYDDYRVLDIGCGWGVLSLAASLRASKVFVFAIDSNARAIQCAERSTRLNNITNIFTKLTVAGEHDFSSDYDLVLANPPYYANFGITEQFAIAGQKALKPGGKIVFVTKLPHWYKRNMIRWFTDITIKQVKNYWIVAAKKH